jgi:hypothetical protein
MPCALRLGPRALDVRNAKKQGRPSFCRQKKAGPEMALLLVFYGIFTFLFAVDILIAKGRKGQDPE